MRKIFLNSFSVSIVAAYRYIFKPMSIWLRVLIAIYFVANLGRYLTKQDNFSILFAGAARYSEGAMVHLNEPLAFTYPSFFALLLSPLTVFGYGAALIIFYTISFLILITGFRYLSSQLIAADLPRRNLALFLVVAGSFRFFQGVFDDQQSDLLVFGALLLGSKYLVENKDWRTPGFWALAGAIKANPLFMIVPLFASLRLRQAAIFIAATALLWILPDMIGPSIPKTTQPGQLELPSVVINKEKKAPRKTVQYPLLPQEQVGWPRYLREWLGFTLGAGSKVGAETVDNGSWWNQQGNAQNQAITHWTAVYLGVRDGYKWVFVAWALVLSLSLALLIRKRGLDLIAVLLSYQAFVLLGPVSSKPHFLPVIGLLMFVWNRALINNDKTGLVIPGVITFLLAVTTPDLIGFKIYNILGGMGFYGWLVFILWVYVYLVSWLPNTGTQKRPES